MSTSVPAQHASLDLRSKYRNLRSLVAVLLVAVAALSATVAVIAIDGDGTTTSSSEVVSGRYPTLDDPFQARTHPTPQPRPDESAIASSISQAQSQVEQPRPLGGPDESAVATAISPQTGAAAPDESKLAAELAKQGKLDSMTQQQQQDEAFLRGH